MSATQKITGWWVSLLVLLACAPALAEQGHVDLLGPVAPFLDDSAVVVARLDVPAINLNAIQAWGLRLLQQSGAPPKEIADAVAQVPEEFGKAQKWLDDFQAAGGREIFFVGYVQPGQETEVSLLIVRLEKNADAKMLVGLIRQTGVFDIAEDEALEGPVRSSTTAPTTEAAATQAAEDNQAHARLVGGTLVFGQFKDFEKLKRLKPVARPEFDKALAATDSPTLCAAVVFNPSLLKQLDNPNVMWFGPLSKEKLSKLRWAALGVRPPPQPFLHLQFQASDANAAKDIRNELDKQLKQLGQMGMGPVVAQLTAMLLPRQQEDRLVLALDGKQLDQMVIAYYRSMRVEVPAPVPPASQPAEVLEPVPPQPK